MIHKYIALDHWRVSHNHHMQGLHYLLACLLGPCCLDWQWAFLRHCCSAQPGSGATTRISLPLASWCVACT